MTDFVIRRIWCIQGGMQTYFDRAIVAAAWGCGHAARKQFGAEAPATLARRRGFAVISRHLAMCCSDNVGLLVKLAVLHDGE